MLKSYKTTAHLSGEHGAQVSRQAQRAEPPGSAAARVVGAGLFRLPFVWQAQHSVHLERRFRGRRSTQSAPDPLGRGCRLCGRHSTW